MIWVLFFLFRVSAFPRVPINTFSSINSFDVNTGSQAFTEVSFDKEKELFIPSSQTEVFNPRETIADAETVSLEIIPNLAAEQGFSVELVSLI